MYKHGWKANQIVSLDEGKEILFQKKLNQAIGLETPTTLEKIANGISNLSGLLLNKIMPSGYAYLLTKGERYETGSDYTEEELNTPVEDLMEDIDVGDEDRNNYIKIPCDEQKGVEIL